MCDEQKYPGHETLATLFRPAYGFTDAMALKCAVELSIPDIIHSNGGPTSLSKIASILDSKTPDLRCLSRVMQVLTRKKIFASSSPCTDSLSKSEYDIRYDLTPASRLLVTDNNDMNYAPVILMHNDPEMLASFYHLSSAIKDGGVGFEKAHNCTLWEFLAANEKVNRVFHEGLACTARIGFRVVANEYKELFASIQTVVDVGGGTGAAVHEIVKAHPHIKAINFDLPHVIAIAPEFDGVTHVVGDMFKAIPSADVVILKSILHDWDDEDCIKILQNSRKAVPETTGKVIIFEQLVQQEGEGPMDDIVFASDLEMIAHFGGGKERNEAQCRTLLLSAGFPSYRVISTPGLPSIIEAFVV